MRSVFTLLLVISLPVLSAAQFGSIAFHKITSADGLSSDEVKTIVRDQQGYMWFGTNSGLNRYDGYTVDVFRYDVLDTSSISDNNILSSHCSRDGSLFFGTASGVSEYMPSTGTFLRYNHPEDNNPSFRIRVIDDDNMGVVWVLTAKGLFFINRKTDKLDYIGNQYPALSDLDRANVNDLFVRGDQVYIATVGLGLWVFDISSQQLVIHSKERPEGLQLMSDSVHSVELESTGKIWLTYFGSRVQSFNVESGKSATYWDFQSYPRGNMSNRLTEMVVDKQDRLWVSASNTGLSYYDSNRDHFIHLRDKPIVNAFDNTRSAFGIYVDYEGTVWLAMHLNGVYYFNLGEQKFFNYERPDGIGEGDIDRVLLSNWTRCFAEDPEGNLWIGTVDGLSIMNRRDESFQSLRNKDRIDLLLPSNSIRSLCDLNGEYMMIGTGEGVTRYSYSRKEIVPLKGEQSGRASLFIWDMVALGKEIFAATSQGLMKVGMDGSTTYDWSDRPGLKEQLTCNTRTLEVDKRGILWIGTSNRGIIEFDPNAEKIRLFDLGNGVRNSESETVQDLCDDGDILWVGTVNGLKRLNKTNGEVVDVSFPFHPAPVRIAGLYKDLDNILWMVTSDGLIRYNVGSGSFQKFGIEYGLPTLSLTTQKEYITSDGFFALASQHGFSLFKTEGLSTAMDARRPVITTVRILNEEMDHNRIVDGVLALASHENFFTIQLNLFDYIHKDQVQYAYMLDGVHTDWVYNGRNRELTFANLPGGDYVLKFKATLTDGLWSEEYGSIRISVATIFYKTFWFRGLSVMVIFLIIWMIYNYRRRQKQKVESLRRAMASDLHDDIGATLSSIRMYSELGSIRKDQSEELFGRISKNAREMIDSMGDIVWAIKPGDDGFEGFQRRLQSFALEMTAPVNMTLDFHSDDSLIGIRMNPEARKNLYLIAKEAIHNAVKYSRGTKLKIDIKRRAQNLEMLIQDDGQGMQDDVKGGGNGLTNMKLRVGFLKGELSIISEPEEGTTIYIRVPFTRIGY